MDELLFKLTPPEFYVWAFLCSLAFDQDQDLVAIPPKVAGPPGWKFYSRQHLKRILKSLELKKFLVITHSPKNQYHDLVVAITRRRRLNIDVQAARHECSGSPPKKQDSPSTRTCMFKLVDEDGPFVPEASGVSRTSTFRQADSASASAKDLKALKASAKGVPVSLEAFLKLDQKSLQGEIMSLEAGELLELEEEVARISPMARGRRVSRRAKVYAAMRFLQGDGSIKNPAAWVESVAKRAQYDMERIGWKDDRSGSAGRSQSRVKYGGR